MKPTSAATSWSDNASPLAASTLVPAPLARAQGAARLSFKQRDGQTVLDELYQQGCAKIRLPRREEGALIGAVTLNTAGGLTGGDHMAVAVAWGTGTAATVSGQAAERVYRSLGPPAVVETRLSVAAGATAEWLPQETILFDRGAFRRRTTVSLASDAVFLAVESVVFGRAAMGEEVRTGQLRDSWVIDRAGVPLFRDVTALDGAIAERLDRPALGRGARALATIILAAPDAEARLEPARQSVETAAGTIGVSAWNGLLVARCLAPDGACLRRDMINLLAILRDGRPLPRVWCC